MGVETHAKAPTPLSYAVDVNILLYASDRRSSLFDRANEFLLQCAASSEVFCVAWITLMSYMRLSTHPAIFEQPLSPEEAARNVQALLELPQVRTLSEEEGFWQMYREVTQNSPPRGNAASDAHLAALLRQHGVETIYTNDRDFRRFDFLKVRSPFQQ